MKNILYLLLIPILFLSCSDSDKEEIIKLEVDDYNVVLYLGANSDVVVSGGKGKLTCSMEDPAIAEASVNGKTITITGKEKGFTKLTISDEANNTCELGVSVNTKSINVITDVSVIEDRTFSTSLPNNDGGYTITSADESVATAVIEGQKIIFSGKEPGQKTTFTLRNSKDKAEIAIIEVKVIYDIKLSQYTVNVKKGETVTIYVTRGNGGYSIEKNTNICTAQINGNAIQITGGLFGNVTLLVEDAEKKQKIGITVNVTN